MAQSNEILEVPCSEIYSDNMFNCRGVIDPMDVIDLARNIQADGLIQPIVVQPWAQKKGKKYRIVCGHRRFMAIHTINQSETIRCIVQEGLTDEKAMLINLLENIKRKDLNIVQEAQAIERFWSKGWTHGAIAKELKVNVSWVQLRCAVLKLPEDIQKKAAANLLTQAQILVISAMRTKDEQYEAVRLAIEYKLKGDRGSLKIKPPKKKSIFAKGHARDKKEIGKMQEILQGALGNTHFGAGCLAWTAGIISDFEFFQRIQRETGGKWQIPI